MGKISDFRSNWDVDLPLREKLRLARRNTEIKIKTGATCCGHPGEPGC